MLLYSKKGEILIFAGWCLRNGEIGEKAGTGLVEWCMRNGGIGEKAGASLAGWCPRNGKTRGQLRTTVRFSYIINREGSVFFPVLSRMCQIWSLFLALVMAVYRRRLSSSISMGSTAL